MSDSSTLLSAMGVLATAAVQLTDTPESRNCIVVGPTRKGAGPGPADVPAFIPATGNVFGSIYPVHGGQNIGTTGGLANLDPVADRGRAVAIPSLSCTIMGIARMLLAYINTAAETDGPLTEKELARAILAYNAAFLNYTAPPVSSPMLSSWSVGLYLTLPLEFDTVANAWATNFATIRTLAGRLTEADDIALGDKARPLTLPKAADVITTVEGWLDARADILTLVNDDDSNPANIIRGLRWQLLTNPSKVVFHFIEVFRQLRAGGPSGTAARRDDILKMVVGICEGTGVEFLRPVAQCTAGNAVLRRFQMALDEATPAELALPDAAALDDTRTILATVLGLVPHGASWQPMREWGPTVVPSNYHFSNHRRLARRGKHRCSG